MAARINIQHFKMHEKCFLFLHKPDSDSVFLTVNAEIGNWENPNLVASISSNDTTHM